MSDLKSAMKFVEALEGSQEHWQLGDPSQPLPPQIEVLEKRFNAALNNAANGIREYQKVMQEIALLGPSLGQAATDIGKRGMETGKNLSRTINAIGDDFIILKEHLSSGTTIEAEE